MLADQVLAVLARLGAARIPAWLAGGWAVDALVGRQTREHGDLDLAIDAARLDDLIAILEADGFRRTVDQLPSRAEYTAADGRRLDLHPIAFAADGSAVQAGLDGAEFSYRADGFTTGTVLGVPVPCLSAAQQLQFRTGYALRAEDRHDLPLLRALPDR